MLASDRLADQEQLWSQSSLIDFEFNSGLIFRHNCLNEAGQMDLHLQGAGPGTGHFETLPHHTDPVRWIGLPGLRQPTSSDDGPFW